MTVENIEKKIDRNRASIDRLLSSDMPIYVINDMVKTLAFQNELLIAQKIAISEEYKAPQKTNPC